LPFAGVNVGVGGRIRGSASVGGCVSVSDRSSVSDGDGGASRLL